MVYQSTFTPSQVVARPGSEIIPTIIIINIRITFSIFLMAIVNSEYKFLLFAKWVQTSRIVCVDSELTKS